jgi:hypothetical protein
MTGSTKKGTNFTYQALALMSRLFYKKFGDAALPIIRDVWYQMGLASGERLKEKLSAYDFKSAAGIIDEMNKRDGGMGKCPISGMFYHVNSLPDFGCDVGLENAGRPICEAVMSVNKGQFKSICGCDVEMNIVRSRAAGADCCEIIYRPIDVSERK